MLANFIFSVLLKLWLVRVIWQRWWSYDSYGHFLGVGRILKNFWMALWDRGSRLKSQSHLTGWRTARRVWISSLGLMNRCCYSQFVIFWQASPNQWRQKVSLVVFLFRILSQIGADVLASRWQPLHPTRNKHWLTRMSWSHPDRWKNCYHSRYRSPELAL